MSPKSSASDKTRLLDPTRMRSKNEMVAQAAALQRHNGTEGIGHAFEIVRAAPWGVRLRPCTFHHLGLKKKHLGRFMGPEIMAITC